MIVAAHQPDLLPYTGFYHKMAKADVFDLKIYDQFVDRGYQRRVRMRGEWAGVPIDGHSSRLPILDVRIKPDTAPDILADLIEKRYKGAKFWDERGPEIVEAVRDIRTTRLWQFNMELIIVTRDILGITTPISVSRQPEGRQNQGVISALKPFPNVEYLSGTGARGYMGDCAEYKEAGIPVYFSNHKMRSPDSILTTIFDHEDPLSIVLEEEDEPAPGAGSTTHDTSERDTA